MCLYSQVLPDMPWGHLPSISKLQIVSFFGLLVSSLHFFFVSSLCFAFFVNLFFRWIAAAPLSELDSSVDEIEDDAHAFVFCGDCVGGGSSLVC